MNFGTAENSFQYGSRSGQRQRRHHRRCKRNLHAQAGVRRRADRANMVRRRRVFRMSMHGLRDAHGANQRHSEQTNNSHRDAPTRETSNHVDQLDDFKLRWSRSYS
jgi:hypothetical protein